VTRLGRWLRRSAAESPKGAPPASEASAKRAQRAEGERSREPGASAKRAQRAEGERSREPSASAKRAQRGAAERSHQDPERAARRLLVRSRREAAGLVAGAYTTAFRGGGVEFEELRPYVPGDDLRTIDWNATARSDAPWVKRLREERDQTLLLLVDLSASMAFGSRDGSKAALAAHAAALLAASAGHAGDRAGLVLFDDAVRLEIAPERGPGHTTRLVHALAGAARRPAGGTGLAAALERARAHALGRRRSIVLLFSDLRDDALLARERPLAAALAAAARRHDLVVCGIHDPREDALPDVGSLRVADPERPGRTLVLASGSAAVRARYAAAAQARRRAVERRLRGAGADVLWLRAGSDPLRTLVRFFRERTERVRVSA
jgi:uncharacterized protein (DUF58 family)